MLNYTQDYLLDKRVKIFQPVNGYRASTDAIMVSSLVHKIKENDKILDVGSGTGAISLCLAERFKTQNPQIIGLELQPELTALSNLSAQANHFENILHYFQCHIKNKPDFIFNTSSAIRLIPITICPRLTQVKRKLIIIQILI